MSELTLERIEQVLDERVRPILEQHEGNLRILSYQDGVLRFRLLGQCANCPSAVVTAQELIAPPIKEALPEIQEVILDSSISDETWSMAKAILKQRREQRASAAVTDGCGA